MVIDFFVKVFGFRLKPADVGTKIFYWASLPYRISLPIVETGSFEIISTSAVHVRGGHALGRTKPPHFGFI